MPFSSIKFLKKKFFEDNNYFGYPKESIGMFFKQGELPMIDENGKIIIDSKDIKTRGNSR